MKRLILPLKGIWYDKNKSGEKTEEYRLITPYWVNRFIDDVYLGSFKSIEYDPENEEEYARKVYNLVGQYARIGLNVFKRFDELEFTKGYPRKDDAERRMVKRKPEICIGYGLESMGAIPNKLLENYGGLSYERVLFFDTDSEI